MCILFAAPDARAIFYIMIYTCSIIGGGGGEGGRGGVHYVLDGHKRKRLKIIDWSWAFLKNQKLQSYNKYQIFSPFAVIFGIILAQF